MRDYYTVRTNLYMVFKWELMSYFMCKHWDAPWQEFSGRLSSVEGIVIDDF